MVNLRGVEAPSAGCKFVKSTSEKKLNFELQRREKPHTMASTTPAKLSEEEIDDLIYFARAGEQEEFNSLTTGMLNPLVKRTTIIGAWACYLHRL